MSLLQLFSRHAPNKIFAAIFTGTASGIAYAMLIPIILAALSEPQDRLELVNGRTAEVLGLSVSFPKYAALYLAVCVVILLMRTYSQVLLVRVSIDITRNLRQQLYKKISNASTSYLEQASSGRLIQTLTTDVARIVQGAGVFPDILIQLSSFLGLMVFLAYLSPKVFGFVLILLFFGVISFQLPMIYGSRYFVKARNHMDALQEGFRGLVEGSKELKLNRSKREHFIREQLIEEENKVVGHEKTGYTIIKVTQNYGDLLSFVAMGSVGFIFVNYHPVAVSELVGIIMVLLYISGPVSFMLNAIPEISRANISLQKFLSLADELPQEEINEHASAVEPWSVISLENIVYRHLVKEGEGKAFSIGPVNARIKRGEITFIVGGNGSGKSTLSKAISLHYPISGGCIKFGDVEVGPENIASYREEIACIYSDYFLFKKLHNPSALSDETKNVVAHYLKALEIDDKVSYQSGCFSTLNLSDGQRRRLALLVSLLDEKQLYVFDEWAADQDPYFKEIFYFDILPKMKKQGKTIVAISHDDRYFGVADQILVMEEGVLVPQKGVYKKESKIIDTAE